MGVNGWKRASLSVTDGCVLRSGEPGAPQGPQGSVVEGVTRRVGGTAVAGQARRGQQVRCVDGRRLVVVGRGRADGGMDVLLLRVERRVVCEGPFMSQ